MDNGGDIAKALACGADAVMLGEPLSRGRRGAGSRLALGRRGVAHETLPRGSPASSCGTVGIARADPVRPVDVTDGTINIVGALRRSIAKTGYSDLKEFQRVELVVNPAH